MAIGGPVLQGMAALEGAENAKQGQQAAMMMQWLMYQQQRKDTAPWREGGAWGINELTNMIKKGPGEFEESPGYQFRLKQGLDAIERGAAARGGQLSGAEQKALARYGQDYATSDYDNFLARYYQSLNPYQSLAGLGLTGTGMVTNAGSNAANQMSNYLAGAGYYQGAGTVNAANAFSKIGSGAGMLGNYLGSLASSGNAGYAYNPSMNYNASYNEGYSGAPTNISGNTTGNYVSSIF